jgi:hypothetical protein
MGTLVPLNMTKTDRRAGLKFSQTLTPMKCNCRPILSSTHSKPAPPLEGDQLVPGLAPYLQQHETKMKQNETKTKQNETKMKQK